MTSEKKYAIIMDVPIKICRCVGIGRRDRLKICYPQGCVGSSPTAGTIVTGSTITVLPISIYTRKVPVEGLEQAVPVI